MSSDRGIRQQYAISYYADDAKGHGEEPALLRMIRCVGDTHVRDGAKEVTGDGQELDLGVGPLPQAIDNSRQESRVAYAYRYPSSA